jgi:5-methylcytosine-specific restriction protein A
MTRERPTRDGVLTAVAEFDELGRDEFLRKYGFGPARSYFLVIAGKRYDSKAIVGAALGAAAADFSGGDQTVKRWLEELNFEVQHSHVLKWTREELVLACAVLAANSWAVPALDDWRILELSELLQTDRFHPTDHDDPNFRSPQSILSIGGPRRPSARRGQKEQAQG